MCPPNMAMLHLTLRLHKICHIARNRQVPKFNSCMLKTCTVEYNLPPTKLIFAIDITAGKPRFHNFCKNSDFFLGGGGLRRTMLAGTSQPTAFNALILRITKPSAVSVFTGPFAKCLCPTHIPYWQKKNIWRYFSRLPYFYILYEIMLAINIKK